MGGLYRFVVNIQEGFGWMLEMVCGCGVWGFVWGL